MQWYFQVCEHCGWTAHTSRQQERCPNGCGAVVTAPGTIGAGDMASAVSKMARRLATIGAVAAGR
jgi:hypothetical protein